MSKRDVTAGSTSISCVAFVQDSSSSIGAGLAGLTNATSGLIGYYVRNRGASTSFGFASLGSATVGWTSGGFLQIDSVGLKGHYRLDLPDACFASGSPFVNVNLGGAANMAQCPMEFTITAWDNQTALSNTTIGGVARDVGGRVLGNTTTGFSGVGTQADVEQWGAGAIPSPNVTGVPIVDVKYAAGTQVYNSDGTLASAGASTVTMPTLDSAGSTVPDSGQFAYHEVEINGGTGTGQRVILTTATGTPRQYNVLSGTLPLGADSTSTYLVHDTWLADAALIAGVVPGSATIGFVGNVSSGNVTVGTGGIDSAAFTTNARTFLQSGLATPTNITAGTLTTLTDLTSTTFAEPSSVPAATASLKDKIGWMAAISRNKVTQTATTQTLRNSSDTATIGTSTVADDSTTFSRGQWS